MRCPALLLAALSVWPSIAAASPEITLTPVVSDLKDPVYLTHAGDGSGRLFIVEQAGRIRVLRGGVLDPQPFLDIRERVVSGGEMGLLSVAFHPRFSRNGRLFVDYTGQVNGQLATVIAEYRVTPDVPDRALPEARVLLTIRQPFANHNGGQLQFGPDGYLYIGMGDGGSAGDPYGNGQNLAVLLGKMLRIDVDGQAPYAIPPDNPFAGGGGAAEIWAYGLRNPWRFSFDRGTSRLFAADVGQDSWEEIDLIVRGGNYGWNRMEGPACFPPQQTCNKKSFIAPIAWYGRAAGISVTGGYVYRGNALPALQGTYLFGDYGSSRIWALTEGPPGTRWDVAELLTAPQPISSFGEDEAGEVYVVGYAGTIFRIEPQPASAP